MSDSVLQVSYFCNFKYRSYPSEAQKDASYQYFVRDTSTPGYLQSTHFTDALHVLNAARQKKSPKNLKNQ
jgi:hypothetical protein